MLDSGLKYGGQQKVVMVIVLETYPLDPCLFLSNRLHMAAVTGLPACLSLSKIDEQNGSSCTRAPLGSMPK